VFLLLSTSDTDLLSARASAADWRLANPARTGVDDLPGLLEGVDLVVVRILGGRRAWEEGLDALLAGPVPVVVLGGEQAPDADLMKLSTVPAGVAAEAHTYLAQGGRDNLAAVFNFLSDTVLLTGFGFAAPVAAPDWGPLPRESAAIEGPVVAVLYYRAHHMAGNTAFVESLCRQIEAKGARPLPIFTASLRTASEELLAELRKADALVVTVLAAGGTKPATVGAGGDEAWDVGVLAGLDVPILQALCLTSSRASWEASDDGLSPLDAATQVAIPEFDGRIITVPFSFKEIDPDGLSVYVADEERAARVAGIATAHARLRHIPVAERRIVLMLSAYPTKHSRIGNAVGLDTPASTVALLAAMRERGYRTGSFGDYDGDGLIHALIAAGGQDPDWLTEDQLAANKVRIPASRYAEFFATLPDDLRASMIQHWGPPPGELYVDNGDIVLAAMRDENIVVMVQPPRGFGANPVAIYHDPDLPPSHHYLAAYRWVADEFGAHAVVHVGKHGNLEWLPGKNVGMSASDGTDAALGDLPLIYPFLVNDPGEGTQAKRRAHATLIDHLIPPMARAESYGDIARLEQLLDEHANIAALDPAKLPAIRAQIWTLIQAAKMDHDLGLDNRPGDEDFDEFILHVDGWLCEVKDVQIRDGLHILGAAPTGEARINLVLAMLRARQMWAGKVAALPGLREALGLSENASTAATDAVEEKARALVTAMEEAGWPTDPAEVARITDISDLSGGVDGATGAAVGAAAASGAADAANAGDAERGALLDDVRRVLAFAAGEIVPRLARTTDELTHVLHALDGGYIPAGPSGSPLRGLINVLPTGRNFYSVDPKAIPSALAWETGQAMAESLLARYRADYGDWPRSVGLSAWGTSAMRTAGDDIAEILALIGVRPIWDPASRRVTGLSLIEKEELGRPRIDVTVRISGFFRDAFPHVVAMLDDAFRMVAELDEPDNYVREHARRDNDEHGDWRRATMRIFGSRPGAYGAGILPLIDSRNWRDDKDLAEVYAVWGGFAYGRDLDGVPARPDMENAYRRIDVAAKNIDTREHDIADSDDYFQYHGGMIATVRALTGRAPAAYVGDSTNPDATRTRSLTEETARIFRARVVNPRWIAAMRRHGYKGAFELAATVDYLFGFDATAGVVTDWMYEQLAASYVLDPENQKFMQESNPWALHGITERLLEAADRKLWESPSPDTLTALQEVFLATEGDLEDN
jgi:cobaltochelatase CobN